MKKSERQALYDALLAEQSALNGKIRNAVFSILNQIPHKSVSFVDNNAYSYVEGHEDFIEVPVFGARIRNGVIELSLEAVYDEDKDKDVPSWDEDCTRAEHDHYTVINWLSILNGLT